jgi:hypothetical protein
MLRLDPNGKINVEVYNLYLRKISEINSTSINSDIDLKIEWMTSGGLGLFKDQLYISYKDMNYYQSILVTDLTGHYITKHVLIQTSIFILLNSFTFDQFGNILFTTEGRVCFFSTFLNKTRNCTEITIDDDLISFDYPLYSQVDQSGRLVVIDSMKQKIQFYGPGP